MAWHEQKVRDSFPYVTRLPDSRECGSYQWPPSHLSRNLIDFWHSLAWWNYRSTVWPIKIREKRDEVSQGRPKNWNLFVSVQLCWESPADRVYPWRLFERCGSFPNLKYRRLWQTENLPANPCRRLRIRSWRDKSEWHFLLGHHRTPIELCKCKINHPSKNSHES